MRLMRPLVICSLIFLGACAGVDRPDGYAKYINRPGRKIVAYQMKTDYDVNGNRLPDAKPVETKFQSDKDLLDALGKSLHVCFDAHAQKEIKRAAKESADLITALRERCAERCWGL